MEFGIIGDGVSKSMDMGKIHSVKSTGAVASRILRGTSHQLVCYVLSFASPFSLPLDSLFVVLLKIRL